MAQPPYPSLVELIVNNLAFTAWKTLEVPTQAPSLTAFVVYRQQRTREALTEAVQHLSVPLEQKYVDKGIPICRGPPWTKRALERDIAKGTHTSTCTPEMTTFICREMRQCVQYEFIIILSVGRGEFV